MRRRGGAGPKTVAWCAAAAAFAFLLLWQQVQATRTSYAVSRARSELKRHKERLAYLRMEFDRLAAPERLDALARRRLGMRPPTPESLVFLPAGPARTARAASDGPLLARLRGR